jgi:fluoride ion exporter CrcB/FEX
MSTSVGTSVKRSGVWRVMHDNGLGIVFGVLFLVMLAGQALSGHAYVNDQQVSDGSEPVSLGQYLTSSSFAVDVVENWQSEYLQFFLYIFATVWLVQRGSSESKPVDQVGPESDKEQRIGRHATADSPRWARAGDWRVPVFSRSLGLVMGGIFLLSWAAQSVAGWAAYNTEQLRGRQDPVSWLAYLGEPDFWNRTTQNWQSEMLAVGSMAVLAVYLRQRGSPESKPVGASHGDTGDTG